MYLSIHLGPSQPTLIFKFLPCPTDFSYVTKLPTLSAGLVLEPELILVVCGSTATMTPAGACG